MPEYINSGIRKTRKDHYCHGCEETIPKGTMTHFFSGADNGEAYTVYTCESCLQWCKDNECRYCFDNEDATDGYVRDCKEVERCPVIRI